MNDDKQHSIECLLRFSARRRDYREGRRYPDPRDDELRQRGRDLSDRIAEARQAEKRALLAVAQSTAQEIRDGLDDEAMPAFLRQQAE